MAKYFFLFSALVAFAGCYQVHSDDAMRAVPVTNNPNVLPHTAQKDLPSSVAY